jgi:2-dehydro-3-deoxyphosphooctonate aldolase (KDO 8-P synthase)
MNPQNTIAVGELKVSNALPFTLFGGMNVLESRELALEIAASYKEVTDKLGIPYVFKASFDKANRSSISSFRGPGLEKGCEILAEIKETYGVPVISDIHEPYQAKPAAEVIDVLQLPAFLCRQTDLVVALAETGRPVNVKKAQFLAAHEMGHIIRKFEEAGNKQVLLCERGSSFGYNNLVVDPLNFGIMKRTGCPVVFDVTHSLQIPGGRSDSAGGRRQAVFELMLAGMSQGIGGLFLESHPDPSQAKCDGPCALPLDKLEEFLSQAKAVDDLVKGLPTISVE